MKPEELKKVRFHFVSHMSMEHEHTCTYIDDSGRLGFCDHTKRKKNGDFGRSYRHFRIDSNIYKSKEKFLKALESFSFGPKKPEKGGEP